MWDQTLQLSHNFKFLTDAILCVAARHLAAVQPNDSTYHKASIQYLCCALSGFRQALDHDLNRVHPDAFIATSVLLLFDVWANVDSSTLTRTNGFDPSRDFIITFCSSLKQMFLRGFPEGSAQKSTFLPYIRQNAMTTMDAEGYLDERRTAEFQSILTCHSAFSRERPNGCLYSIGHRISTYQAATHYNAGRRKERSTRNSDAYNHVLRQVSLISSFLPARGSTLTSECDKADTMSRLARSIFMFPIKCRGPFADMVFGGDPIALHLLYQFYHAAQALLPPIEYWWAHKRATLMSQALKEWLSQGACSEPADFMQTELVSPS